MKLVRTLWYRLITTLLLVSAAGGAGANSEAPKFFESSKNIIAQNTASYPVIKLKRVVPTSRTIQSLPDDFDASRYELQGLLDVNPLEMAKHDRITVSFPAGILNTNIEEQFNLHREKPIHDSILNYVGTVSSRGDGYSRMSIDTSTGAIVGTFNHDGEVYRIMSMPDSTESYILKSRSNNFGNKGYVKHPSLRDRNFELNRIHDRKLMRDRMGPGFIRSKESKFHAALQLTRGKIGKIDIELLVENGNSYIKEAVKKFSPFLKLSGNEEFEIFGIEGDPENDERYLIEFRQISQGVPVNELSRIEINSASGEIQNISFKIYDSAKIKQDRTSWIDENNARRIALKALEINAVKQADINFFASSALYFEPSSDKSLHPYWRFISRSGTNEAVGGREIVIDAISGEFRINDAGINADWEAHTKVCITDYGSPIQCPTSTADGQSHIVVYEGFNDDIADPEEIPAEIEWSETPANPSKYSDPFWIINDAEYNWNSIDDVVCCATGDVNVVLDTPAGDPSYIPSTDTLIFPPKDSASSVYLKNGEYYSSQKELVVHERAHRLMVKRNPDFGKSVVAGKSNVFLRSLGEGLADVLAATTDGRNRWKRDWVFGDGFAKNPRDARISRKFSDYNGASSFHTNATVFSNFFYRVSSKENVSARTLLRLALRVSYNISDPDSDAYSWDDFWAALESALDRINYSPLTEAVSEVWGEMDPQGTTAPSIPLPPPSVWGSFVECYYDGRTVDNLQWTDVAPSYAIYYRPSGSTVWEFEETTSQNYGYIYAPYDVEWKVKSCKGDVCGPLSSDSYLQLYNCGEDL